MVAPVLFYGAFDVKGIIASGSYDILILCQHSNSRNTPKGGIAALHYKNRYWAPLVKGLLLLCISMQAVGRQQCCAFGKQYRKALSLFSTYFQMIWRGWIGTINYSSGRLISLSWDISSLATTGQLSLYLILQLCHDCVTLVRFLVTMNFSLPTEQHKFSLF